MIRILAAINSRGSRDISETSGRKSFGFEVLKLEMHVM